MQQQSRWLGIDLGSRRTKAVVLENGIVTKRRVFEAWSLEKERIIAWVTAQTFGAIGATGYSRRLAEAQFEARVITEIKAFALGVHFRCAEARTVVDIGGQDAKTIRLDADGQAEDFEMNDRCAAGTGKFFEMAARTLGIPLEEMPAVAQAAPEIVPVNSTCAVFAESEIIGRLADGCSGAGIARGIYHSVAERLGAMLNRLGHQEPVVLVGGGANVCLAHELSGVLGCPVQIPEDGAFFGALGVAIHAGKETKQT
jgi:predicted CoA-substrate-specific enzyme activase